MSTNIAAQKENTRSKLPCLVCGKEKASACSRCHNSWYCGRDCQKKDWKQHKKICFPPNSTCLRCLEPTEDSKECLVPHPDYMLEDMGSSYGAEVSLSYRCKACSKQFNKVKPRGWEGDFSFQPPNANWCFKGSHTIKPIGDSDQRRICRDIETMNISDADTLSDVQAEINKLNESDTRVLVIQTADGSFPSQNIAPVLDISLPKLQEVKLLDISFRRVNLNDNNAPNLRKVEMQNIPDSCDIGIKCSSLEEFNCRYHRGDCAWVQDMLDAATKLEEFHSYKLGLDAVHFTSSHKLKEVHVHRSGGLNSVSIWAPQLQVLRLQACYSLDRLSFPEQSRVAANNNNDNNSMPLSRFTVDTTNSCLSSQVIRTLESNSRAQWDGDVVDEDAGVGGMESVFRQVHQQGFRF